jgi:hypothetical protein
MFMVQNELVAFYGYDCKEYPARKRDGVCLGGNLATSFINLLHHDRKLNLLVAPIRWQIPYTRTTECIIFVTSCIYYVLYGFT